MNKKSDLKIISLTMVLVIVMIGLVAIFIQQINQGKKLDNICVDLGYNSSRNVYCYVEWEEEPCFMHYKQNISAEYWCNNSILIVRKE